MKIGILQPGYLPWLGFFEQLYRCDIFVYYDDVQYDRSSWRNRNKIKTPNGSQWLTVPVILKFEDRLPVNRVMIDNRGDWRKKHLLSIRYNYGRAPFFKDYIGIFEEAYAKEWNLLIDIDMFFMNKISELIGIVKKKTVSSSELDIRGDRITRLINICKRFGADVFYEGAAGKEYIPVEEFAGHGIRVEFQDYRHPVYKQLHGEFIPYLSVIDLLFNHGPESLAIITGSP